MEADAKIEALKAMFAAKTKSLLASITTLEHENAKLRTNTKEHRRSAFIAALQSHIRERELVIDVLKTLVVNDTGRSREDLDRLIVRKTTGGPTRFRPATREEIALSHVELERQLEAAKLTIKRLDTAHRSALTSVAKADMNRMGALEAGGAALPRLGPAVPPSLPTARDAALRDRVAELEGAMAEQRAELEELHNELAHMAALEARADALAQQYAEAQRAVVSSEQALSDMAAEVERMSSDLKRAQADGAALRRALEDANAARDSAAAVMARDTVPRVELDGLRAAYEELQVAATHDSIARADAERAVGEHKKALAVARAQASTLQEQLMQVTAAASSASQADAASLQLSKQLDEARTALQNEQLRRATVDDMLTQQQHKHEQELAAAVQACEAAEQRAASLDAGMRALTASRDEESARSTVARVSTLEKDVAVLREQLKFAQDDALAIRAELATVTADRDAYASLARQEVTRASRMEQAVEEEHTRSTQLLARVSTVLASSDASSAEHANNTIAMCKQVIAVCEARVLNMTADLNRLRSEEQSNEVTLTAAHAAMAGIKRYQDALVWRLRGADIRVPPPPSEVADVAERMVTELERYVSPRPQSATSDASSPRPMVPTVAPMPAGVTVAPTPITAMHITAASSEQRQVTSVASSDPAVDVSVPSEAGTVVAASMASTSVVSAAAAETGPVVAVAPRPTTQVVSVQPAPTATVVAAAASSAPMLQVRADDAGMGRFQVAAVSATDGMHVAPVTLAPTASKSTLSSSASRDRIPALTLAATSSAASIKATAPMAAVVAVQPSAPAQVAVMSVQPSVAAASTSSSAGMLVAVASQTAGRVSAVEEQLVIGPSMSSANLAPDDSDWQDDPEVDDGVMSGGSASATSFQF